MSLLCALVPTTGCHGQSLGGPTALPRPATVTIAPEGPAAAPEPEAQKAPGPQKPPIHRLDPSWFLKDEAAAAADAKRTGRGLFVLFHAEWCMACVEMQRPGNTLSDQALRSWIEARYVPVRVDATDDDDPNVDAVKAKYKVVGLPTIVVLDEAGKERARFVEYVSAANLRAQLEAAARP